MLARKYLLPGLLAVLILGAGVQACASVGALSRPSGAMLRVDNNNFADMNIYAIRDDGFPRRIGTVNGLSSSNFGLPYDTFAAGSVYLVGVPIGGFGAAGSGALSVFSGQSVTFTIESSLNMSWARID